ncbi:MAG: PhzF family phenazine biosynthesis protein [Candidatus Kariarchaeaceae archaeon]|jgi:trans-2,3-dihydro-3-hydroxyanthranilate isomerase
MGKKYFILNVFSDVGIEGGNQLAVFPDAGDISSEEMQEITKQFNFSESTFVTKTNETDADVRIFTPGKEIAYAGHPTVGTLNVLEKIYREKSAKTRIRYDLNLRGGKVQGSFENNSDGKTIEITSFEQVPAKFVNIFEDRELILNNLGITESDLANDKPFQVNTVTVMKFLFIQVKNSAILAKLKPNYSDLRMGVFLENDICPYVFTTDALDGGTVRARFFVPLYGINEDPATGGIQSSFGLCLNKLGILKGDGVNLVTVEQGYEMERPSKIYNKFHVKNGELVKTETGGKCFYFARGELM